MRLVSITLGIACLVMAPINYSLGNIFTAAFVAACGTFVLLGQFLID